MVTINVYLINLMKYYQKSTILFVVITIILIALPAMANLPNFKKFMLVGTLQPGTKEETKNYLDPGSIKKRGKVNIFYTNWAVWKYPPGLGIVATKEFYTGNCDTWEVTRISFAAINAKGQVINQWEDGKKLLASPGTIEDKTLQIICK